MSRALRRYQAQTHMLRRWKEKKQQMYWPNAVPWINDPKTKAKLKEQPQSVSRCICCTNKRESEGPTIQERRAACQ